MRTIVVSDLHLGAREGDLLRDPGIRARLLSAIEVADRLVLLGDALELRHRPAAAVLEIARPFLEGAAEALGDGEILIVPGNHDHQLATAWLERRRLQTPAAPLGLEQRFKPDDGPLAAIANGLGPGVELAYPGAWLRPGVYATHGHYLDCHLTVPTFESLGVSVTQRVLGGAPRDGRTPDDYEHAQAPLYAFAYSLAQSGRSRRRGPGPNPTARVWAALHAPGGRRRLRKRLLGSVVVPGIVRAANAAGLGPYSSDLSLKEVAGAGLRAMIEVATHLDIEADHIVFGHTHRRGPLGHEPEWTMPNGAGLHNSGSWVHAPLLLGRTPARSPFWPGSYIVVEDEGPPRLETLLDDLGADELRAADHGG